MYPTVESGGLPATHAPPGVEQSPERLLRIAREVRQMLVPPRSAVLGNVAVLAIPVVAQRRPRVAGNRVDELSQSGRTGCRWPTGSPYLSWFLHLEVHVRSGMFGETVVLYRLRSDLMVA